MKKIFSFGAIAAAVMAFAGCAQEIEQPEAPQQEGVAFELVAEVSTKTVNDKLSTKWAERDDLNVFFTEKGSTEYGVNNHFTVADVETGLFTGTIAAYPDASKSYDWFAIYPYNSYVKTPAATSDGYLTLAGKEQRQVGVDNLAHIAGKNYPLFGKLLNNPGDAVPALELTHASALLKVVVKNTTSEPMTVTDVYFTAPEDVVGTYYFDITGKNVVYTGSGESYVSNTATLKVSEAEVPAGGEAAFYMAVKPFTAQAEAILSLAINNPENPKTVKLSEPKTFEAGVITTLNFTVEEAIAPNLPKEVTVAEFLAAAEDATEYILTGVITSVANTTYGNFYLKDETAEVYIYGLCSPTGEQKYWATSGAKVGDTITVKTVRTSYNGSPQGKNAIFMALEPFVSVASEWGVVGDLNNWGATPDVPLMTVWYNNELFVAHNVEIASGDIKVRANNAWNDAKNYGLEVAGKIYANKYYTVMTAGDSQNATPMEYGTYDVWFDLANKRIALMTPGKDYADAVEGGDPVVVIEGLADHTWGVAGSFQDWKPENAIEAVVDGDYVVAENVQLKANDEFKFVADNAWTLNYGSACDVNVGETYTTYKNGDNMKFVGETGAYNLYFSLVDAKFYMEAYDPSVTISKTMEEVATANSWVNSTQYTTVNLDDVITVEASGGQNTGKYYTNGNNWRLYQTENPTLTISAKDGYTIKTVKITYTADKTGCLTYNSSNVLTDTVVNVDAASIQFGVGNTGTATNGQVRITAIEVVYQ